MIKTLSAGGLGDALMVYAKLNNMGDVDHTHVMVKNTLLKPVKEFYKSQNRVFCMQIEGMELDLEDLNITIPVTVRLNESNERAEYCKWGGYCRPVEMPALYYCITDIGEDKVTFNAQLNTPKASALCNPSDKHIYKLPRDEVEITNSSNECKGNILC